jgi:hypothetical protein
MTPFERGRVQKKIGIIAMADDRVRYGRAAPPQVRCTAVALGYNICFGVIGGSTPLAATWLVERTGDEIAPAFLIMGAAALAFFTILRFRETYRAPFVGGISPARVYG